jgi:hypothetical protein
LFLCPFVVFTPQGASLASFKLFNLSPGGPL